MHAYWPLNQLPTNLNVWIATLAITLNFLAWGGVLLAAPEPYVVEPIRDPEIVTLLEYIRSDDHSGETWQVTLTELEAEQTITWYLQRYPQIPFAHPRVEITPDYIAGEGDATIAGLRVHVGGKARITLSEGLPQVEILALNLPLPGPIRHAIEDEIETQLRRADLLPVRFSTAEWQDGQVVVRGVIR
ncbi:MAG: hypothetical protein KDJ52_05020 [Anaerolineae bacterium]|nr:hypothetical protein [Anaerolineae bacterium]